MEFINAKLEAMAAVKKQYPEKELPEIAFAGRSNVGKSTFINSILNRKNLAYTSSNPGKTRTVNFYNINEEYRLVDLPGYGYAQASKSAQEEWAKSINEYLESRECLREVMLLCDLRHKPTALDKQMYEWILYMEYTGYVIGTKMDKLPRTKVMTHVKEVCEELGIKDRKLILPYSGFNKSGIDEIRAVIDRIVK